MCAISSRARSQIATKPSQRIGTATVECSRGGDVRKCASAEERAAKKQKTTACYFDFTEKVYGLSYRGRADIILYRNAVVGLSFYGAP